MLTGERKAYGPGANVRRWRPLRPEASGADHAVFLHVPRTGTGVEAEWLWRLECGVKKCVDAARVGELCGVELSDDEWIAFLYGPGADELIGALETVLAEWDFPPGAQLVCRRGGLEAPEERRDLSRRTPAAAASAVGAGGSLRPVYRTLTPADLLVALSIEPPRRRHR